METNNQNLPPVPEENIEETKTSILTKNYVILNKKVWLPPLVLLLIAIVLDRYNPDMILFIIPCAVLLFVGSIVVLKFPKTKPTLVSLGIGLVLFVIFIAGFSRWFFQESSLSKGSTMDSGWGLALIWCGILAFVAMFFLLISILIGSVITYRRYKGKFSLVLIIITSVLLVSTLITILSALAKFIF
jgi:hypothetical protein